MPTRKTTAAKSKTAKKAAPKRASSGSGVKKRPATKKKAAAKKKKTKANSKAGDSEVTIDRRRADQSPSSEPKLERRKKVARRRQIDPTTCERDYSDQEVQFMNALDDYKRTSGRMFPTCSEVLEVIRSLGYVQLTPAELAARAPQPQDLANSDDQLASSANDHADNEFTDQNVDEQVEALA